MKLIVDECISKSTIHLLKELGFNVIQIKSVLGKGAEDEDVFAYASQNRIPLITHDRRFGKIYFDYVEKSATTIILRNVRPHPNTANELLKDALSQLDFQEAMTKGKLILISQQKIRIRDKIASGKR
ncbi:MAG: DUF5615 family PIN-like protein [Candidatus Heimdallarchaeota archaeon]